MSDWRDDEPCIPTPPQWYVKLNGGETFEEALARCFTIDELKFARDMLEPMLLRAGRIARQDIDGPLYWIVIAAQDYLPGVLAGRSVHKINWGYSDNRYINAKWQYRMVCDAIHSALVLKQKVAE